MPRDAVRPKQALSQEGLTKGIFSKVDKTNQYEYVVVVTPEGPHFVETVEADAVTGQLRLICWRSVPS